MDITLTPSPSATFLHAVGKSTLRQGFTVPRIAEVGWLRGVPKGGKVAVTIRFADTAVVGWVRRIDNARGHLQFRYEAKEQAPLRAYLASLFAASADSGNCVLRITEIQPREFLFEPVAAGAARPASLSLYRPHFHNCVKEAMVGIAEFAEIADCLAAIPFNDSHGQTEYNKQIRAGFVAKGWQEERRIVDGIGLRCDFEKNGLWIEVEFGNARVYYQDYIKFLLAHRYRGGRLGILLCPTNAFAQLLCDLGRKRAILAREAKGQTGSAPSYSGMMSYEKAMRELPFLEFMLTSSVVVAGIEIERGAQPAVPVAARI